VRGAAVLRWHVSMDMLAVTGLPIAVAVAGACIAIGAAFHGAAAQNPIANAPGPSAAAGWRSLIGR